MPQTGRESFIPKPIQQSDPAKSPWPVTSDGKVICERCGEDMFRMHAVWRCPKCRFKTDCCGW